MTVDFTKHYLLKSFDPDTDIVVVLRRYDESSAPWGVHVITVDAAAERLITHRTVSLLTTDEVHQLATAHGLDSTDPYNAECDMGMGGPLLIQASRLFDDYLWTQVLPIEWRQHAALLRRRVHFLAVPTYEWALQYGEGYLYYLEPFLDGGWKPFTPLVEQAS